MLKRKESDIKSSLIKYLRARGHLVIPIRSVGIWNKARGAYIPYADKGVPDLLVFERGVDCACYAVEVKRPDGQLSKHQVQWMNNAERYGITTMVARRIEDVIAMGL